MVLAIHKERSQMLGILRTWGQQCDRVMFFADFDDASIGALHVRAEHEGSADSLINKMSRGVRIVSTLFGSSYDWFVKADTDSFFIIENLRHFLLQRYNSEEDIAMVDSEFLAQLRVHVTWEAMLPWEAEGGQRAHVSSIFRLTSLVFYVSHLYACLMV